MFVVVLMTNIQLFVIDGSTYMLIHKLATNYTVQAAHMITSNLTTAVKFRAWMKQVWSGEGALEQYYLSATEILPPLFLLWVF